MRPDGIRPDVNIADADVPLLLVLRGDRDRRGRQASLFRVLQKKENYQFTKSSRIGFNVLRAGGLRPHPRLGPGCPYKHATRRVAHEYESSQVRYQSSFSHSLSLCL